jgi:hypothetical protein
MKIFLIVVGLFAAVPLCKGALILSGTSYSQNFDGIGGGSPTGWDVYTSASSSSLGSVATFNTTISTWTETGKIASGGFWNVASADGLSSGSSSTAQNNSTDRAIGFRQIATGGFDPGAAVVLNVQNTAGLGNFALSLKIQFLADNSRSTDLVLDYRIGDSGNFTSLGTYSDPNTFGSTTISFNSSDLSGWNNQSSDIWFRIVALSASTGTGSRDTFGIDDFSLSYSPVPEPGTWGFIASLGLLAIGGLHSCRQKYEAEMRMRVE